MKAIHFDLKYVEKKLKDLRAHYILLRNEHWEDSKRYGEYNYRICEIDEDVDTIDQVKQILKRRKHLFK